MQRQENAGTVTWVDLQTPDAGKAHSFYGTLLGWTFEFGDEGSTHFYTFARVRGRNAAGVARLPPGSKFPPRWSVYFASDDVESLARRVTELGGKIVVAPIDVGTQGRMAYFADPTGAQFGAWQARAHTGAQVFDEPGALAWTEVYSRDAAVAREFYTRAFELEAKLADTPGVEYWTLHKGPRTVCGLMQPGKEFPAEYASSWNTYFAVTDVDATAKKAVELGGQVVAPPFDTPFGRLTWLVDSTGAPFCVIKPVRPSSTW